MFVGGPARLTHLRSAATQKENFLGQLFQLQPFAKTCITENSLHSLLFIDALIHFYAHNITNLIDVNLL